MTELDDTVEILEVGRPRPKRRRRSPWVSAIIITAAFAAAPIVGYLVVWAYAEWVGW